jgi:hypothetical protein
MAQQYKIYVLNGKDSVALAHNFQGANDIAAMEEALSFTGAYGVEVWDGHRVVLNYIRKSD